MLISDLVAPLVADGYVFVIGSEMRADLLELGSLDDWPLFAASWNDLEVDHYMADGGRYRRRRHALYVVTRRSPGEGILRKPHGPHWQSRDYNPLNGGVERWFEPVTEEIATSYSLSTILRWCRTMFEALAPSTPAWDIELHQFRIEARANASGNPTPEGLHRDGVDFVLVLMIQRVNIASGTTTIHAAEAPASQRSLARSTSGSELGSFTLTDPFDAALVYDQRVYHGVTPVEAIDPTAPAYRDVLVVTFRKA